MKKIITILFLLSSVVWGQIQNPGFEDGTAHWTGDSHLTISEETSIVHGGLKSLNCTFDSQTQSQCDLRNDLIEGISGSTEYTVSAWFYDNDPAGRANLVFEWYDNSGSYISSSYYNSYTTDQASWQQLIFTATSPSNATSCKIGSRFYDVKSNWDGDCTIYVDDYDGNPAPLPVELTTFSASIVSNRVELKWQTATEVNNYGFYVERKSSFAKAQWNELGFVNGHGNSNSPKEYSFIDKTAENSGKYFYRLKQVDVDGQFEYSPEIEVTFGTPAKFELSQNYPNPFNPTTNIRFTLPEAGNVKLAVYNLLGQKVADLVNRNMEAGFHNITFNGSNLTSGIYIYRLEAGNTVMIRKMQLVK